VPCRVRRRGERAWRLHVHLFGGARGLDVLDRRKALLPPPDVGWESDPLPEQRVETIIDEWGLPAATENTITDADVLLEELSTIREGSVAFNHQEQLDGVRAVGVPVDGSDGQVVGAFSVASPANRLTDDRFETELPEILLGVANEFELENSLT
jgi:hypothetical protein